MGVIMKHEELDNKTKQELKKIIIGYQLMVLNLKKENEILKHKVDNFESLQAGKCCECESDSVYKYQDLYFKMHEIEEMAEQFYKDVKNKLNIDNKNRNNK